MKKLKKYFKILFYKLTDANDLMYINSYDILPPPLDAESEKLYIKMLESDMKIAKDKLIEHNLRLVVYIAKKFDVNGASLEDLVSIGSIGLIKAINTFKSDKNIKLATYASKCIENEILMFLRKASRLKNEVSLDEPLNYDREGNELLLADVIGTEENEALTELEKESEINTLGYVLSTLKEQDRNIINMRFGVNGSMRMTQKEVADTMSISQSYISRLEKRIVTDLKKEMIKLTE